MTASAFVRSGPVSNIACDRFQAGHAGSIPVARSNRSRRSGEYGAADLLHGLHRVPCC
jgi:hypothetical protein